MRKLSTQKHVLLYLTFVSVLFAITVLKFYEPLSTKLGEVLFLNFHYNSLAIKVLESKSDKTYYDHYLLGRIQFIEGNLKESIINFTFSIKQNPNFKENFYGRGLAYAFAHTLYLDEAEQDFKKYIELDNREFERGGYHAYGAWAGYNDLAWVYFLMGRFEDSEKTGKIGLEISEHNPWLANTVGIALVEQGKCTEAKEYLESAITEVATISASSFGEAYTGDDPGNYNNAFRGMQKTISENLKLCKDK